MGTTIVLLVIAIAIWRFTSSRRLAELLKESEVVTQYPTVTNEKDSHSTGMMQNGKVGYKTPPIPKVVQQKRKYESSLDSEEIEKNSEILEDFDPAKAIIYSEIMRPKYF